MKIILSSLLTLSLLTSGALQAGNQAGNNENSTGKSNSSSKKHSSGSHRNNRTGHRKNNGNVPSR